MRVTHAACLLGDRLRSLPLPSALPRPPASFVCLVHFLAFALALKAVIASNFFRKGGMPAKRQAAFHNTENTLLIAIVAAFLDVILADLAQTRQIFI